MPEPTPEDVALPLEPATEPEALAVDAAVPPATPRRKLLLFAVSLVLSLLFAEGALRLTGIAGARRGSPWFAGGNHPRFLFQPDAEGGYALRPGFHGRELAPGREFDVPVAVDRSGLRDHDHSAPSRPRLLALGDSMTFGEGVTAEEAWPAVLERALGVRVYAAGVPGFASSQMRASLRRLLPRLQPDLVVVALSPHWDQQRCAQPFVYRSGYIVASGYAEKLRLIDGNLYLADVRWPLVGSATAWAKRWSHLARLALPALRGAAGEIARGGSGGRGGDGPGDVSATAAHLVGLRGDAASAGVPVLVVLLESRGAQYVTDRDALASALRRRNIPFLELDSLIEGGDWDELRYPRDTHWNAAGHLEVGRALAPRLHAILSASERTGG